MPGRASTTPSRTWRLAASGAQGVARGAFELVASPTLLAESTQVLSRPTIAAKAETQLRTTLMTALASDALLVDDPATQDPVVVRDSSDDYLVALARAAGAQVIVTGDGHPLDLPALEPPALEPRRFVSLLEGTG